MFARRYAACNIGRMASERMFSTASRAAARPTFMSRMATIPRSSQLQLYRHASSSSSSNNTTTNNTTKSKSNTPSKPPTTAYVILGSLVFIMSTYASYQYISYKRAVEESAHLDVPHDVSDRYEKNARTFDAEVDWTEWATGINGDRKKLLTMCKGNILEVSCGTGRNLPYFPLGERRGKTAEGRGYTKGCRTITFVDQSREMIEVAREKFEAAHPEWMHRTRWLVQSGMEGIPLPTELFRFQYNRPVNGSVEFPPRKFDTVIDSMGLCSVTDPEAYLDRLGDLVEPTGQILLLEHGRSDKGWVNRILDDLAKAHANRHGCWWNRDIDGIVRESGLTIVQSYRHHFGTTMWFILRTNDEFKERKRMRREGRERERKRMEEEQ